ncbi:hypothetical protein BCR59_15510 [Klebsiella pneumoniae]|nr:hypothetical protein BCR59_15510 [Klebsiella pneumoniae]
MFVVIVLEMSISIKKLIYRYQILIIKRSCLHFVRRLITRYRKCLMFGDAVIGGKEFMLQPKMVFM